MAQQQKTNSTSTRGFQLYNANAGDDSSTLALGYWNDSISLTINPILPQNMRKDGKVFDYDNNISTVINLATAKKLLEGIKLIEEGKQRCVAVVGSSDTRIKISNGEEYGDLGWNISLIEVNERKQTTGMLMYVLNVESTENELMVEYNEEDSSYDVVHVNHELELFKIFLEESIKAFMKAQMHVSFHRNSFVFNKVLSTLDILKGMMEQVIYGKGNTTGSSNSNSGGSVSGSRSFSTRRRRTVGGTTPQTDNNEMEDLEAPQTERRTSRSTGSTGGRQRGTTRQTVQETDIDIDELEQELLGE